MSVGKVLCVALIAAATAVSTARAGASCVAEPQKANMDACTAIIQDSFRTDSERAEAYANRGLAFAILGKYPDSVADFDEALKLFPDYPIVLNNRAWTFFKWHGSAEGMHNVQRALELDSSYDFFWDTRAHLRQVQGNFAGAFDDYEVAVGIGGADAVRVYQCGLLKRGLYKGEIDGVYNAETRAALKECAFSKTCDPLPDNADFVVEAKPCDESVS